MIRKLVLLMGIFLVFACNSYAKKPNVIIFLVDDFGVMDTEVEFVLGEDGKPKKYPLNEMYETPAMKELAQTGCRFTDFYAMSVCSPSRTCIITGQNSARHHVSQWINAKENNKGGFGPDKWLWEGISGDYPTLPRMLSKQGYKTIHVGKAHFGPYGSVAADPRALGFDINIAGGVYGQPGSYYGTNKFSSAKQEPLPHLEKYWGKDIYLTDALFEEAKLQIEDCTKEDKPFFLYFAHYAVHAPFQPDKRYVDKYKKYLEGDNPVGKNWPTFASMVESTDQTLAKLLILLKSLNIAEDTLILFLGDNGSDSPLVSIGDLLDEKTQKVAAAAPFRGMKATRYEGGMRTAFIASWAKPNANNANQKRVPIESGSFRTGIAAVYDLLPTILSVVEAPEYEGTDGLDLSKRFASDDVDTSDVEFLMHFPHFHRNSYFTTYRKGDWKLIYNYQTELIELFNLKEDISESKNLASEKPELVDEMLKGMKAKLKAENAQLPNLPSSKNFR